MTEAVITPDAGAGAIAPVVTDAPAPEEPKSDAPRSQDDKIRDALASVGALEDAPDGLKKPNVAEQARNDDGKFKAKEPKAEPDKAADKADPKPEPLKDAEPEAKQPGAPTEPAAKPKIAPPERFNDGAKAAWEAAPDEVKHEVTRMHRELEKGLTEYKTKAAEIEARDAPLKPFREMAEQYGVKFEDMLSRYVTAEQSIMRDPVQGILTLAQNYVPGGVQAFVAQLTGQQQGQPDPRDAQIRQLQQQVAQLSQGYQQTAQTLEEQRAEQARAERQAVVDQFAAAHPRAQEQPVQMMMTHLIATGQVSGETYDDLLSQAYEKATEFIPSLPPQPAPPAAPAQTRPAATSISGAPASGSSPRASAPQTPEQIAERALRKYGVI